MRISSIHFYKSNPLGLRKALGDFFADFLLFPPSSSNHLHKKPPEQGWIPCSEGSFYLSITEAP